MDRRAFLAFVASAAMLPQNVIAQIDKRTIRIGWLTAQREVSLAPYLAALRRGFGELGYLEGQNLVIEYRFGDDQLQRVPELAAELVKSGVELIVAQGAAVSEVAKQSLPVPIVYIFSGDPTAAGFADGLSHPRGNMTGVTMMAAELNGKRLEILRDIVPELRRVAIIANPEHDGVNLERANSEQTGQRLGMEIRYCPTPSVAKLEEALAGIKADPVQAISIFSDGFAVQNRKAIFDFAAEQQVPVVAGWSLFARSGAICTYGPLQSEQYRRLAAYVDRIANGVKPSELPIQQPTKFETVVNLKTAKTLGLSIPPALLASADEIIE
ncbi:ABC transporter substrate-binding protein [Bradyrhizobium lablabi]|uniref:ABC transporter substrate-binding protein n=1 Tax=Bradyrhizobium lablabi TaxID=722472 RepID=UPI001BACD21E|nr:ABC transporter substrate-binding protein [Bradyrhizobium lablabi]MBR0693565.1 ABC transporter substrate-binding protein [Bradyrhizobium lablabi]